MKKIAILMSVCLLAGLGGCVAPYGYYDGYYGRYDNGWYGDRYGYNDGYYNRDYGGYNQPQYDPYYRDGYYGRYQYYNNWQNGY
jgi:hypothetical protein